MSVGSFSIFSCFSGICFSRLSNCIFSGILDFHMYSDVLSFVFISPVEPYCVSLKGIFFLLVENVTYEFIYKVSDSVICENDSEFYLIFINCFKYWLGIVEEHTSDGTINLSRLINWQLWFKLYYYLLYIFLVYFLYRVEYLFIRKKYIKEVVIDFQIKCDIFEADNMAYHHDIFF